MKHWLYSFLIFLSLPSSAQYVQIGNATYQGTYRFGPMVADAALSAHSGRFAYIYPSASWGKLQHGDTIRGISFYREGFDSLRGTINFKIYMGTTHQSDFGPNPVNWNNETQVRIGIKKVYDADPTNATGNLPGWVRFEFDDSNVYVVDTSNGRPHLEILTEYTQNTNQASNINWRYDTDFSFPFYSSNNETKYLYGTGGLPDSLRNSSIAKPAIRLHIPKYDREASLSMLYALGRNPLLMGRPDSIKTFIENTGRKTIRDQKLYLNIRGTNEYSDSLTLDSLQPYERRMVVFGSYLPQKIGRDSLFVSIPGDGDSTNNLVSAVQDVTYNVFSHADPVTSNAGGIGFNGSSGDFVARFYTDSAKYLNQVKVDFALGGRRFQIGIWDVGSNGMPGNNLYTSDTLTSVAGTYILSVRPKVLVQGGFFVGLRQTGTTNIAFAFQEESPVRPNTFYFAAPLGDTNWVNFDPGFDFKFNIQPRLEVANDVGPLRIAFPKNDTTLIYSVNDSIGVNAVFFNYGSNDQDTAFNVVCEIRSEFNQLFYRSVKQITLDSEDSVLVQFDKKFSLNNRGLFLVNVFSELSKDQVRDNDPLSSQFRVDIPVDLALTRYFQPSNAINYELNVDSIYPTVRIQNNGSSDLRNFMVRISFRKNASAQTVYRDSVMISLLRRDDSQIVPFNAWFCNDTGAYQAMTTATVPNDIFPSNDTMYMDFRVVKSNDVGIDTIVFPAHQSRVGTSVSIRPYVQVRNYGLADQAAVDVLALIRNQNQVIWKDSVRTSVQSGMLQPIEFKAFTTGSQMNERYEMMVYSQLADDQDSRNDTMQSTFGLMASNDLSISRIERPGSRIPFGSPDSVFRFEVKNNGYLSYVRNATFVTEVWHNDTLFWQNSFVFNPFLGRDESRMLSTLAGFRPDKKGYFEGFVSVIANGDEIPDNDSLRFAFFVSPDYDVLLDWDTQPADSLFCGTPFAPEIKLQNIGIDRKDADSGTLQIRLFKNGILVDQEQIQLQQVIEANDLLRLSPKSYALCDTGWYEWQAQLLLNDDDPDNQSLLQRFYVARPYDLLADSSLSPRDGQRFRWNDVQDIFPAVRMRNAGTENARDVSAYCVIRLLGNEVYSDSSVFSLNAAESAEITFTKALPLDQQGTFDLSFYHGWISDLQRHNDTLQLSYIVADLSRVKDPKNKQNVLIYPNPFNDEIRIVPASGLSTAVSASLISAEGRVISSMLLGNQESVLSHLGHLAPGMYTLVLHLDNGETRHFPMIKTPSLR